MLFCESAPFVNSSAESVHPVFRGKAHVHLISTDEEELVNYARSIGMAPKWLQRGSVPHFDCTGKFMARVLEDPMVEKLDRKQLVDRLRHIRSLAVAR